MRLYSCFIKWRAHLIGKTCPTGLIIIYAINLEGLKKYLICIL